jgi:hypothetical protein
MPNPPRNLPRETAGAPTATTKLLPLAEPPGYFLGGRAGLGYNPS